MVKQQRKKKDEEDSSFETYLAHGDGKLFRLLASSENIRARINASCDDPPGRDLLRMWETGLLCGRVQSVRASDVGPFLSVLRRKKCGNQCGWCAGLDTS